LTLLPLSVLLTVLQSASPSPAPSPAPQARPEIAAELDKGVRAYNGQDIAYYQSTLAADAVYIADDGATFVGKERVVGLFTRIFGRTPKPRLEVSDVVTGGRGDVAWARFKWTLSDIERARPGVATALFVKDATGWKVVSIQNTAAGHGRPASPAPGASPSPAAHQH
jgi:ketosteroid isomerase-like protein